jgi:hypothetical protein
MRTNTIGIAATAGIITLFIHTASAAVVTFEEIPVPGSGYVNASSPAGGFVIQGATFKNNYEPTFGSWSGFAISNKTDSNIGGWDNQYSAFTPGGQGGSSQYAIGYYATYEDSTHLLFPALTSMVNKGAFFTNTAYAGISMRDGDSFAKKFGGASGNDADWFKLTITGYAGGLPTGSVDFYLADYRFADNSQDYIVDQWTHVDFTTLGTVDQLRFSMSSTDNGTFGMNTPAYFAMDSITVPEPSALLCSLAGLGLVLRRKR